MANFYWRGQYRENITGISAFDFNEPSNWVTFEIRSGDDCIPYMSTSSDGKVVIDVAPIRGVGISNYGLDDEGAGWGWNGEDSNVCRAYSAATRAPGPGDVVVIGDDYAQAMSPLLFGGFIGGETGGVWINGADDGAGGYTHAVGGTTDSALAAFYYGGMGLHHADFNYPWQRIGGGFTANVEKYTQQLSPNGYNRSWAEMLWNFYFVQGGTYTYENPDGSTEIIEVSTAVFSGTTWTSEQLTPRTQSLRIKADYIEEAVRSYVGGTPHFADLEIVKNIKPATDPETLTVYNRVVTDYNRYSRNLTSFVKGYCRLMQNLPATTLYKDWHGPDGQEPYADEVHDNYYENPDQALILDGVTAASVRCYIPDQIKLLSNSVVGSFHIDDNFTTPEDRIYCVNNTRKHTISGKINKDLCLTDLGLTGTAEAEDLDSKLLVRASHSTFIPTAANQNPNSEPGTFKLIIGNNTGLSGGITCDISKIEISINRTASDSPETAHHKPARLIFSGTGPIVVEDLSTKYATIITENIETPTPIYIGVFNLGEMAWFYPAANDHPNWYFGIQNPNGGPDGTFVGGIKFLQEANATDSDYTSEFTLSPYFRLHSAMVGLTAPASLTNTPTFRTSEAVSRILKNNVGGG